MNDMEFPPMELPAEEAQPVIHKREIYEDDKGHVLTVLEDLSTGRLRYVGQGVINLQSPQGLVQQMFNFKIVGEDIRDAFRHYDEAAQIAGKQYLEELDKQQRKAMLMQGLNGMANGMPGKNVSRMPGR